MYNFHPPLGSFPFVLITLTVLFEAIFFFKRDHFFDRICFWLISLAAISVVFAFFSGYQASELADSTFKVPDEIIENHHSYGRILLFLIFPSLALRYIASVAIFNRTLFRTFYWLSLLVSFGLVMISGFTGAKLVFEHGAAVSAKIP